jgi:hypothetical protein
MLVVNVSKIYTHHSQRFEESGDVGSIFANKRIQS